MNQHQTSRGTLTCMQAFWRKAQDMNQHQMRALMRVQTFGGQTPVRNESASNIQMRSSKDSILVEEDNVEAPLPTMDCSTASAVRIQTWCQCFRIHPHDAAGNAAGNAAGDDGSDKGDSDRMAKTLRKRRMTPWMIVSMIWRWVDSLFVLLLRVWGGL